jgi:hypothetical protein
MAEDRTPAVGNASALSIPVSIDDVDARWLTAALRQVLPPGTEVRSFEVETIGTGVGLMGLLYRLHVDYTGTSGAKAPATMIVKLPVLIDATRRIARVYRFYEKEVAFYRELAPHTALQTPAMYYGQHDLQTDDFVLVLQDVGHLRAADQVAGCEHDDALAAVVALARHHASFWNDARLSSDALAWLPFGADAPTPEGVQQGFATYWEPFVEFMGHDLDTDVRGVGEWLPGAARDLLSVPDGHALTIAHGDYRLDNLFFDNDRNVTAVDWQIVTKGVGGYDFAYFVSQSLCAADRRAYLDDLVHAYLGTLADAGVDYPEDEFWVDVRRTLLFCLAYPVQAMGLDLTDPRAAALVREMADRSASAILEMDALEHVR